ncbi:hypothetical protein [Candidatus Synchoanobacter obligatus]|uniref:Uncharacterized protein n=1 Tax=Candidatus Synchoanobacter obligatus TaxID=2919597 RepID=A0ABT1L603_9GAMM|nr:hypothetical protein [Candidatus Synchoanobacter obligatus]MCP8351883.1 hypothetical protein [Candidatus Synchoanobacter obligatus]
MLNGMAAKAAQAESRPSAERAGAESIDGLLAEFCQSIKADFDSHHFLKQITPTDAKLNTTAFIDPLGLLVNEIYDLEASYRKSVMSNLGKHLDRKLTSKVIKSASSAETVEMKETRSRMREALNDTIQTYLGLLIPAINHRIFELTVEIRKVTTKMNDFRDTLKILNDQAMRTKKSGKTIQKLKQSDEAFMSILKTTDTDRLSASDLKAMLLEARKTAATDKHWASIIKDVSASEDALKELADYASDGLSIKSAI